MLRLIIQRAIILILFFLVFQSFAIAENKGIKKAFLGVYMRETDKLNEIEGIYKENKGIIISGIISGSSAEKSGLMIGDILVKYDENDFSKLKLEEVRKAFSDYLKKDKKPGDSLKLEIIRKERLVGEKIVNSKDFQKLLSRQKTGVEEKLTSYLRLNRLKLNVILGERAFSRSTAPLKNSQLFPNYQNLESPLSKLTEKLVKENYPEYSNLVKRYSDDEWWDDGFRLNIFRYLHRDPLKIQPVIEWETNKLEKTLKEQKLEELFTFTSSLLDENYNLKQEMSCKEATDCIDSIVSLVNQAVKFRKQAFSKLSFKEETFLLEKVPGLTSSFVKSFYVDRTKENKISADNYKIIQLAHKVDFKSLFKAGALLQRLSSKDFLQKLKVHLKTLKKYTGELPKGVSLSGGILWVTKTDAGPLVIGAKQNNRYIQGTAVIIDLGGNDFYFNEFEKSNSIKVQIDLAGNDLYSATGSFAQGSAFMGNSILIDLAGNDKYSGIQFAQGSSLLGTGVLIDFSGDDEYKGQEYLQGTSFWGLGMLLDFAGNDTYSANLYAQAVGGVKGLGLLYDQSGNDTYYASGKYPSSYGTKGIFKGASQGLGIGFRGLASGGIGVLLDSAGDDNFTAGNFSQGGGYFFGLGVLKNTGNGNDFYQASHYGQGFSAHSAIGLLLDTGGDDYYQGLHAAVQGVAWDLGIAALIDFSGNDYYDSSRAGFSKAASAHNGFAMLLDLKGKDQYKTNRLIIAENNSNSYHGGSSFSLFMDSGGENDLYPTGYLNNQFINKKDAGLFWDY